MMDKPILEAVHETAKSLHKVGGIDKKTMHEYDAWCLPPIKVYTAAQIKKIRTSYHAD